MKSSKDDTKDAKPHLKNHLKTILEFAFGEALEISYAESLASPKAKRDTLSLLCC